MGKSKSVKIPALVDGDKIAVSDKEKANVLARAFAAVHSGKHLDDTHRLQKERALRENENVREKREEEMSTIDMDFTMTELKIALQDTGYTTPGQDQLCYAMFRELPIETLKIILGMFGGR